MTDLRSKLWAKITAMLLLFGCMIALCISAAGVIVLALNDAYFDSGTALREEAVESGMYYYQSELYQYINAVAEPDIYYFNKRHKITRIVPMV